MKATILWILAVLIAFAIGFNFNSIGMQTDSNNTSIQTNKTNNIKKGQNMKLGAFSVSLSVKDITVSKQFYENLGFTVLAGDLEKNYLIMKNENSLIGLFQGMFENNILTFNPGWDENGKNIEKFDDVREIQSQLISKSIKVDKPVDENTTGPSSFMITDPDGNVILIDQHR